MFSSLEEATAARKAAEALGDDIAWTEARAAEEAFLARAWKGELHPRTRGGQFRKTFHAPEQRIQATTPTKRQITAPAKRRKSLPPHPGPHGTGQPVRHPAGTKKPPPEHVKPSTVKEPSRPKPDVPEAKKRSKTLTPHEPEKKAEPAKAPTPSTTPRKKTHKTLGERAREREGEFRNEHDLRKNLRALKPGESYTTNTGVTVTRVAGHGPLREYDVADDGATNRGQRRVVGIKPATGEAFERHKVAVQTAKGMADPGPVTKGSAARRYEEDFGPEDVLGREIKRRYYDATEPTLEKKETFERYYPDGGTSDVGWGGALEQVGHVGDMVGGPVKPLLNVPHEALFKFEQFLGSGESAHEGAHEVGKHAADALAHGGGAHHVPDIVGKVGLHAPDAVHQGFEHAPNIRGGHGAADTLTGMADSGFAGAKMSAAHLMDLAANGPKGGGNALHHAANFVAQMATDPTVHNVARIGGHVLRHLVMGRYEAAVADEKRALAEGDVDRVVEARALQAVCKQRLAAIEADTKHDCPDCGYSAGRHKKGCKHLIEAYDERLHPRGRGGQWIPKPGDKAHYFHGMLGKDVPVTVVTEPDKRGFMKVKLPDNDQFNGAVRRVKAGVVSEKPADVSVTPKAKAFITPKDTGDPRTRVGKPFTDKDAIAAMDAPPKSEWDYRGQNAAEKIPEGYTATLPSGPKISHFAEDTGSQEMGASRQNWRVDYPKGTGAGGVDYEYAQDGTQSWLHIQSWKRRQKVGAAAAARFPGALASA
jgi:hypothetical protein